MIDLDAIDFQALIPRDWSNPGLIVHLQSTVSFSSSGRFFIAEISRCRRNALGRELKPEHVITICAQPDDSLPELLRMLATLFEQPEPVPVSGGDAP